MFLIPGFSQLPSPILVDAGFSNRIAPERNTFSLVAILHLSVLPLLFSIMWRSRERKPPFGRLSILALLHPQSLHCFRRHRLLVFSLVLLPGHALVPRAGSPECESPGSRPRYRISVEQDDRRDTTPRSRVSQRPSTLAARRAAILGRPPRRPIAGLRRGPPARLPRPRRVAPVRIIIVIAIPISLVLLRWCPSLLIFLPLLQGSLHEPQAHELLRETHRAARRQRRAPPPSRETQRNASEGRRRCCPLTCE